MTHEGMLTIPSSFSVQETLDRAAAKVESLGLRVFARIDHSAAGNAAGLPLRPTQLLMFGDPMRGTPLMQDRQSVGLDLPSKMLAWEDQDGRVWLSRNETAWLAQRHGTSEQSADSVAALEASADAIARYATQG